MTKTFNFDEVIAVQLPGFSEALRSAHVACAPGIVNHDAAEGAFFAACAVFGNEGWLYEKYIVDRFDGEADVDVEIVPPDEADRTVLAAIALMEAYRHPEIVFDHIDRAHRILLGAPEEISQPKGP